MSGLLTPALAAVLIELVVAVGFDGVEPVGLSASRQADISGLSGEVVGAEEESVVDGAALGFVDGHGVAVRQVPLSGVPGWDLQPAAVVGVDQEVARLVKRTAMAAGVRGDLPEGERGKLFAGHSLRAGLASSAEVDERYVQKQLGHTSAEMTRKYQRRRDRFRVNLTKASGL